MKANTFRNMGAAVVPLGDMGGASLAQAFVVNGALGANLDNVNSVGRFRTARWLLIAVWMALATVVGSANAASDGVVLGSVDPFTKRVTVFQDLMVQNFRDGGPIQRFYGGFSSASDAFFMVRAGKTATGACLTEVFRLARISGNRLALAVSSGQVWNSNIISVMAPTFDCTSSDCLFCEPAIPAFGEEPSCECNQGTGPFAGTCDTARPGTTNYGPGEIVITI